MREESRRLSDQEVLAGLLSPAMMQQTIRSLYQDHFDSLSRFVVHNNGNMEDAQDIFQEVMVAFVNLVKQGKFKGEASIKTFLFSINRNLWFNELKKRGRRATREASYEMKTSRSEEQIEKIIEYREANAQLIKIMEVLGENCKKILLLFYYQNMSMKEMVSELSYENEQVVRNKKYKCLKKLEEMINSDDHLAQQLKGLLQT
jgi:RNA polymerase sigma factor (sigma-70 family)